MIQDRLASAIREVPNFPKTGVNFKDITPVLEDYELCKDVTNYLCAKFSGTHIDAVIGVESRGFLFGMLMAQKMKIPFITVRKKGKLPYKTVSYKYDLEYGSAEVEMHVNSIQKGWNVLIHDDLLATGGTAAAAANLVKMQDANVAGFAFLIELSFLNGTKSLEAFSKNIVKILSY
jgi:adenine phosphoribosyltransferase